jgi:phosphoglycolate phosphatase-like HAD superfamily hydrolase
MSRHAVDSHRGTIHTGVVVTPAPFDRFTRAVLLTDFDNTLVRLHPNDRAWEELRLRLEDLYRPVLAEGFFSRLRVDGYDVWYRAHNLAADRLGSDARGLNDQAEAAVTDFERAAARHAQVLPGVRERLLHLEGAGVAVGVVSSNATAIIDEILRRQGLRDLVSVVVGRVLPFDPAQAKPSPFTLRTALSAIVRPPGRPAWYAGDHPDDIRAGTAAGLLTIGVASGRHSAPDLTVAGATMTVDAFAAIAQGDIAAGRVVATAHSGGA